MFLIIYAKFVAGYRAIAERTVNGNSDRFGQLISVCTHKRGNLPEFVEFQVLGTERSFSNVCIDDLKIKLVCLGYSLYGDGAWVVLQGIDVSKLLKP